MAQHIDKEVWTKGRTFRLGEWKDGLQHRCYATLNVSTPDGYFQNGILIAGFTVEECEARRDKILEMRDRELQ